MEKTPIQLLIVDDSLETCDILENYFALTQEIKVCGVAHDGDKALYKIAQCTPDVVLLDLIMPKTDGISVLERLGRAELPRRPRIIVTSAVGQESFTSVALSLGADYYMIKPYDLADLYSRVCMAASIGARQEAEAPRRENGREVVLSRTLLELGIPAHMLGYRYCEAAAGLLLRANRPRSIVKEVYGQVAQEFDTTPECVEGAIRKAIRKAWEQEREAIRVMTGEAGDKPPANSRFLVMLTQRIRLAEPEMKGEELHAAN